VIAAASYDAAHGPASWLLLHAMGESVLGSPSVRYETAGFIAHDYSATFTTNLLIEDLEPALDVARGAELSLPVIELVN
jgi:3-hydroxyisobutyrate dehydrogenase-like beta-hydroxyacid dehydrogenase